MTETSLLMVYRRQVVRILQILPWSLLGIYGYRGKGAAKNFMIVFFENIKNKYFIFFLLSPEKPSHLLLGVFCRGFLDKLSFTRGILFGILEQVIFD